MTDEARREEPRWVSVEERTPPSYRWVLTYAPERSPLLSLEAVTSAPDAVAGEMRHRGVEYWLLVPRLPRLPKAPQR